MTIADQCRALACQQFAAAACPIIPRTERAALQEAAAWNEQMATEIDKFDAIALRALPSRSRASHRRDALDFEPHAGAS